MFGDSLYFCGGFLSSLSSVFIEPQQFNHFAFLLGSLTSVQFSDKEKKHYTFIHKIIAKNHVSEYKLHTKVKIKGFVLV